ncbi:MAG: AAA family ATPase [Alphaproteobacteria bacterium]|nr:AAA family ATPase [Alphaproteobacteria bacterium]
MTESTTPKPLSPDQLCRYCDPAELGFRTTDELEDPLHIIGQGRAVEAIRFAVGIERDGYNMFAAGPSGTGKHSTIRQFLEGRAAKMPTPPDACYVNNFEDPHRPNLISLPAGKGAPFRRDMAQLVELAQAAIPRAFEGEEYRTRRRELDARFRAAHDRIFEEVQKEATEKSIAIIRTPAGIALAPIRDGQVVGPEDFSKWPEDEQDKTRKVIDELQEKLHAAMAELPAFERQVREDLRELSQSTTISAVGHLIDDLRRRYDDLPEVQDYLDQVRHDLVEHAGEFMRGGGPAESAGGEDGEESGSGPDGASDPRGAFFQRYAVNLLVDNSRCQGAPVIYEDLPNLQNLIGRIEHMARFGTLMTNFTLIQPGALHRANGGYLILDAVKVLTAPFSWETLKRALKSREVRIESPERIMSVATTITLEPEPMPLDLKVVLLGDRMTYYLLAQYDPEFGELFKVEVDFEDSMARTPANMKMFSRFLAKLIRHQKLRPFEAGAVARMIEHASRLVDDADKVTAHIRSLCDLAVESDYWAMTNDNAHVTAEDVQLAIDTKIRRADRIRDLSYEQIARKTILIDTSGATVGQVNGLLVMQLGKFPFGHPARITARVRLGRGHVIDIEREVELGGPLHSKGVLILSAFLGARYCPDMPLSLGASLVFEQSYGGVEGDSASSTELYALLSALSEVPIHQSLAVTGSVNQHGQVQAIGGVNEKIEGFFDVCKQSGLTGDQGVLIPAANVQHLMLRRDVVDAVTAGTFRVYSVRTIDEGIELLTGVPAGVRGGDGRFPPDSINGRVEAKLAAYAEAARRFMHRDTDDAVHP